VSSTSMNVASITATAINQGLISGFVIVVVCGGGMPGRFWIQTG